MATRVLAVDDNSVNLRVVSVTLQHAGYEVYTASSGKEALEKVDQARPELILLDITMPEMDGYEVCRRLRAQPATAHILIIMLTANETLEEKIKGFEAGADDYLTKPFQPAELQARMKVLLRRLPQLPATTTTTIKGKTISVFSLRGGIGVSTLATNLAVGLAQIWTAPCAAVDFSLTMGQSALMLNLPLKNTWSDLANIAPDEIDSDLVTSVMMKHTSGVSVLAAPRKVADGELITSELVTKVLELLKGRYPYLILDHPHDFRETTLLGLEGSDEIVLVMAPELASIRATSGALEVFDRLGYHRSHVHLVINWVFEKRGLARKDIENVLHQPVELVIPFAPEVFVSAINLGSPPVLSAPTSAIGALFEDFAFCFSRQEDLSKRPAAPSEAWGRVNERAQGRQTAKR